MISSPHDLTNETPVCDSTECSKTSTKSVDGHVQSSEYVVDYSNEFTTYESFSDRDALVSWAREIGKRNGFVVVIKRADVGGTRRKPRVTLCCERSGQYKTPSKRKADEIKGNNRYIGTKKCGCPFSLKGKINPTNDEWSLSVECGIHNHPLAENFEGHSYAGRLSNDETSLLIEMSKSLVRPKEILHTLKQRDEHNASTLKTIYNARLKHRLIEKAGISQMQHLLGSLAKHKYIECHRVNEKTNVVKDLFWAHPTSLDLLRTFPHVLLVDCTYKTNRYCRHLMEIVGVTSTDMTFCVAFVYMEKKREKNYVWALERLRDMMNEHEMPRVLVSDGELSLMNAIEIVFPTTKHILCRWHISQNVVAKCKGFIPDKNEWEVFLLLWDTVVASRTEDQFAQRKNNLLTDFQIYSEATSYVINNWLNPYKEKFVAVWTNTCKHFGNVTLNRVQSAHAAFKKALGSSQGSFETSWTKIHDLLELQHTTIKASFEKSLTVVQTHYKHPEFKELRGFISTFALEKIFSESKRANSVGTDTAACPCIVRHTHGLPCAHEIAKYKCEGRPIPLGCVDVHWRKLSILQEKKESNSITGKATQLITWKAELELLNKHMEEFDTIKQLEIVKKIREWVDPQSTSLLEPQEVSKPLGRPEGKMDTSTIGLPSGFESVQSGHDSYSPKPIQQVSQ